MDKIEQDLKEGFACIISLTHLLGESKEMDAELKQVELSILKGDYKQDLIEELEWQTKK